MKRNILTILGLSEVRLKEHKDIVSDGTRTIATAAVQGQRGVANLSEKHQRE